MADQELSLLEQLEKESRAKQVEFIGGIAAKLGRKEIAQKPVHPFRGAPDFWTQLNWSKEEKIERFMDNWQSVGGHTARFQTMEEAKQFIVERATELGARHVIRQNQPTLNELGLEEALPTAEVRVWNSEPAANWRAHAAGADIGIAVVDHAIAYTGTITVLSSPEQGRSVTLLPTVMMAIIPVERLKTRMGEVMERIDGMRREDLPAGIHFITGPSRSSDIENDLTIGVHGPGIVYALIVG
ncbi:LutC/YkgG family protein [Paenibacillus guangzhouensis]|uniref:LutC/YkgG family protein n=1 Tax=Paenibacillus guangzhouensis TaxID=1473112 RepID=UPI001266C1A3|nr:lactate utilization protein [Paenibacillus guangzhouensis]